MILDDVNKINGKKIEAWIPYSPHTISKKAKSCEMCHNNNLLLNEKLINNEIFDLMIPKNIINGTLLNQKQLDKLKSDKFKKIRAKALNSI
jgi:hypothetical protein